MANWWRGKRVVLPDGVVGFTLTLALNAGEDSPGRGYARPPSLQLRRKEGGDRFLFLLPLYATRYFFVLSKVSRFTQSVSSGSFGRKRQKQWWACAAAGHRKSRGTKDLSVVHHR